MKCLFSKKKKKKSPITASAAHQELEHKERKVTLRGPKTGLLGGLMSRPNRKSLVNFRRVSAQAINSHKSNTTMLQRLVMDMRRCLEELDAEDFTDADLERWAVLIFESMSASSRMFHSVLHVFDVSEGVEESIPILAAFFHDIVYYGIDGGLPPAQEEVLEGVIEEQPNGDVKLKEKFTLPTCKEYRPNAKTNNGTNAHTDLSQDQKEKDPEDDTDDQNRRDNGYDNDNNEEEDTLIAIVAAIFNVEPGHVLNPFLGLNEFLSAALAVRCLRHCLPLRHLAEIAACIEATIPFRAPDSDGNTAPDKLYQNLNNANNKFDLNMTNDELIKAVQKAIDLSNRDLRNFASASHASFLSNTWNLMHESNIDLRHTTVYRISSFAIALKKMSGFFLHLDPNSLFNSFHGVPSQTEIDKMRANARDNINIASRYLQAKLVAISVLAALAELTGGDAPIALFLGDLPEKNHPCSPGIEDYISPTIRDTNIKLNKKVYDILKYGREGGDTHFDLQNSPLAAYLYGVLGDERLDKSLKHAVCPMDVENAKLLLDSLPRESVVYIATPCATLAESRKDLLMEIVKEYSE